MIEFLSINLVSKYFLPGFFNTVFFWHIDLKQNKAKFKICKYTSRQIIKLKCPFFKICYSLTLRKSSMTAKHDPGALQELCLFHSLMRKRKTANAIPEAAGAVKEKPVSLSIS